MPFGTRCRLSADSPAERDEPVPQLIRIGYDALRGYLEGGIAAWEATNLPMVRVPVMPVEELNQRMGPGDAPIVLDVRQAVEWRAGHLPRSVNVEAGHLPAEELSLSQDDPVVVHCGHADRSTVGISVLERRGHRNLMLLDGGFSAWETAGYEVVREHE